MENIENLKIWQKALSVFLAAVLTFTLWGAIAPEQAEALTGEYGSGMTYDTAVGAFGDYALLSTKSTTSVNGKPSIQYDQGIFSASGKNEISSKRHQGAGTGENSDTQLSGLTDDGTAAIMTDSDGLFGIESFEGEIIVPIEYVAVCHDASQDAYYGVRSSGDDVVLDVYSSSGEKRQSIDAGSGNPTNVETFPGFVQIRETVSNPNTAIGGTVQAAKVYAITSNGLEANSDIAFANANDDSGTAYVKTDGTVWHQPAGGQPSQIASGASTSASMDLLSANYAKICYPTSGGAAYATSSGAESSESVLSGAPDRILAPQGDIGELGNANNELLATLNGEEFLWDGKIIVGYDPLDEQGACQFWVYSAEDGSQLQGPITSSTQVGLQTQDGNYAITYTPISGAQKFAGFYYSADLGLISSQSAPSQQGGTLPNGQTIQVSSASSNGTISYQVTDVNGSPIKFGSYTLALAPVKGDETQGAGTATSRVQHGSSDIYCAIDGNGHYGAVNSSGQVLIPFVYDNYYDLGYLGADSSLNASSYVMVHRDGQWFFFDVADAKPVVSPSAATTPTVQPATSIARAKVTVKQRAYSAKRIYPTSITARLNGKKLVRGRDYKVSTRGGKLVGRYRVTITGMGKYRGTVRSYFKIVPRGTRIRHMHRYYRAFKMEWRRNLKQTSGYEVRYSLDRHFRTGVHYRFVKASKRMSLRIGHLKSHRRYYVEIRTYKKVNGKRYYSVWSKWRSARTY